MRIIYNNAINNERLKRQDNPAANVKVGVKPDPLSKVRPYTDAEAKATLEAAWQQTAPELRYVPLLMFGCGLRIAEAAGLRVSDVRIEDPRPNGLRDNNGEAAGPYVVLEDHDKRTLKNASSVRNVPIPQWVLDDGFHGVRRRGRSRRFLWGFEESCGWH